MSKGAYAKGTLPGARELFRGDKVKYRKKPVVIEAFRMGIDPRPDWFQDKVSTNEIITHSLEESLNPFDTTITWCEIKTLEGIMEGDYGDYIIKGVKGEIYPCKPDIFAMTYESTESPSDQGEVPTYPTPDAYEAACKALWKHRDEVQRLRSALEKIADISSADGAGRDMGRVNIIAHEGLKTEEVHCEALSSSPDTGDTRRSRTD